MPHVRRITRGFSSYQLNIPMEIMRLFDWHKGDYLIMWVNEKNNLELKKVEPGTKLLPIKEHEGELIDEPTPA